jgi:hypothetical protein
MVIVQIALQDKDYANELSKLLLDGKDHEVLFVKNPDMEMDGVVVLDDTSLDRISGLEANCERCVVVTRKRPPDYACLWKNGIRHVISSADPPPIAQLAVLATELRISEYMYS